MLKEGAEYKPHFLWEGKKIQTQTKKNGSKNIIIELALIVKKTFLYNP